jgi:hypothetical protein
MVQRPATDAPRKRTAAWLALLGLVLAAALPAVHFVPRDAPALLAAAGAPGAQALSAPEAIRSHLGCPVCLALSQARGAALRAGPAAPAAPGAAPVLACAAAERSPAAPERDDQRPRAPPLPA